MVLIFICRRTSAVTTKVLKEYKDMIKNTTADLEEHLQEIDKKLQTLSLHGAPISDAEAAERQQIQEEWDSTHQCLDICAQVSAHIEKVQVNFFENISTPSGAYHQEPGTNHGHLPSARLVTVDAFIACKEKLSDTTAELKRHLEDVDSRLRALYSPTSKKSNEQAAEQERIREELDSIKQCLAICAQASVKVNQERINDFEDVSMTDDGHQVIVSTIGDLVSARRVTAGARSLQCLGQMSDESLQLLSQHHSQVGAEKGSDPRTGTDTQFEGRYGVGLKLKGSQA
jgi:Sec-independent protein translocase protein TatA